MSVLFLFLCCYDSLGGKLKSIYFSTAGKQRTAGSIELTSLNSEMERSTQNVA